MRTFSSSFGSVNAFDVEHQIQYDYGIPVPFDAHGFYASVFVIEKATNESVPIVAFAAGNGPNNFFVFSTNEPAESNFTYDSGTGPNTVVVGSSVAFVDVKRSKLARAFTMCLLIVNWLLIVGSVYIALLVLVGRGKKDPAVLFFPDYHCFDHPNSSEPLCWFASVWYIYR